MDNKKQELYLTFLVSVTIPLAQAILTGLLLGAVAVAVLYIVGASIIIASLVAAFGAAAAWLASVRWWRRQLSSSEVSSPLSYVEPEPVRIELLYPNGADFIDLPVSMDKLTALARGLSSGASFTEASWCGGSNKVFSRAEFVQLRDEMLRRGLLELNSPSTAARGYRLTRGGAACVRYLAELHREELYTTPRLLNSVD